MKGETSMIQWLKQRLPIIRATMGLSPGDVVRLRDNSSDYTVRAVDDAVYLTGPEERSAMAHTRVDLAMPWHSFVRQVTRVNGRPVW